MAPSIPICLDKEREQTKRQWENATQHGGVEYNADNEAQHDDMDGCKSAALTQLAPPPPTFCDSQDMCLPRPSAAQDASLYVTGPAW